jgi:ABC-type sugar transport system ATPase subunit
MHHLILDSLVRDNLTLTIMYEKRYPVAVEAEGLRKRFGGAEALRGLNLTVAAGSIYGLLGPNGAGKPNLG